jgi:hypothetical protein
MYFHSSPGYKNPGNFLAQEKAASSKWKSPSSNS